MTDCEKGKIALAIEDICQDQQGRAALIAVGACGVLVKVLKISETEETRRYISRAIFNLPVMMRAVVLWWQRALAKLLHML
jgi:hypothetical protein